MKLKSLPANTAAAAVAILSPYAPDISASSLVDALQRYEASQANKPHYIDKHEAAQALGVSWYTLVRWAKAGQVEGARKIGLQWRFDADRLAFINS